MNNTPWLQSAHAASLAALYRSEAALVYTALESGTASATEAVSSQADISTALKLFRGLTTSKNELLEAEPAYFVVPSAEEIASKKNVKDAGLDIQVIARSGIVASYLLPDPEDSAVILLQALSETPVIETSKPMPKTDQICVLNGYNDVNAVFASGLSCVKLTQA